MELAGCFSRVTRLCLIHQVSRNRKHGLNSAITIINGLNPVQQSADKFNTCEIASTTAFHQVIGRSEPNICSTYVRVSHAPMVTHAHQMFLANARVARMYL
jgi:hypothetical protein